MLMSLAAFPLGYVLDHLPNLTSFLRPREVEAQTLESYLALNETQHSSASPSYLLQYLEPWLFVGEKDIADDRCAFFVGRPCLLLAVLALVRSPKRALPVAAYGLMGLLLTLGTQGPINLPKWLFLAHIPGISGFRQWYHFFPLINVALAALAVLGAADALQPRVTISPGLGFLRKCVLWLLPLAIGDLVLYCVTCGLTFCRPMPDINLGAQQMLAPDHKPSVFLYKNRFELNRRMGANNMITGPLLTNVLVADDAGNSHEMVTLFNVLSHKQFVTVVNSPRNVLERHVSPSNAERFVKNCEWTLRPSEIEMRFDAPSPAFLLTPMNYDLKPSAYLDGERAEVWRANGAMAGVLVPAGQHTVVLHVNHDSYTILLAVRIALQLSLLWLFWRGARGSRPQPSGRGISA
jgi:hypothetical protein